MGTRVPVCPSLLKTISFDLQLFVLKQTVNINKDKINLHNKIRQNILSQISDNFFDFFAYVTLSSKCFAAFTLYCVDHGTKIASKTICHTSIGSKVRVKIRIRYELTRRINSISFGFHYKIDRLLQNYIQFCLIDFSDKKKK